MVNNLDWNDDWVFYDSRFNIFHSEDEVLPRYSKEKQQTLK
jgi:hypothetical protein